jgi:hypothetical protein
MQTMRPTFPRCTPFFYKYSVLTPPQGDELGGNP